MFGRQLPFFSVLVPFWVVAAYAGWRGMLGVWPAALTAGLSFAIPQFLISNFHGPWLVDIVAALCSMAALALLLRVWKPTDQWKMGDQAIAKESGVYAASPPDNPITLKDSRPQLVSMVKRRDRRAPPPANDAFAEQQGSDAPSPQPITPLPSAAKLRAAWTPWLL